MSAISTVDDISCLAWRFKHFKRRMLKSLPFHLRNMAGLHISDKASSPSKNFVDQIFSSKDLCPIGRLVVSSSVDIWWYITIFWCCKMSSILSKCFFVWKTSFIMDEIQISWSCKESKPWPSALLPTAHSYLCSAQLQHPMGKRLKFQTLHVYRCDQILSHLILEKLVWPIFLAKHQAESSV